MRLLHFTVVVGFAFLLVTGCAQDKSAPAPGSGGSGGGATGHHMEGWISSGGELLKDARNPWWVQSTNEVKYCISADASSVDVTADEIEPVFRTALKYWTEQFAAQLKIIRDFEDKNYQGYGIGMQTFRRVGCHHDPDLKILAGYGALNADERAFIKEPERFAAYTVRTSYDRKFLHGKGFIYLGSEKGPFRFRQVAYDRPWKESFNLGATLAHELGHLWGLGHFESGSKWKDLMAENYVERLFELEKGEKPNRKLSDYSSFSHDNMLAPSFAGMSQTFLSFKEGADDSKLQRFAGIPDQTTSMMVLWHKADEKSPVLDRLQLSHSYSTLNPDGKSRTTHFAQLGNFENLKMLPRFNPAIPIYVTPEQQVFPAVKYEAGDYARLLGARFIYTVGTGTLKFEDARLPRKDVYIEMQSNHEIRLFGELDGKFQELTGG